MTDFYKYPVFHQRCDVARTAVTPNYAKGSDCVFHEASGFFQLSASNPLVRESAEFIRDAQTNINSTKPGTPGTYVPGTYGTTPITQPLSRLYYDLPMRKANGDKSVETCVREFGPNYPSDRTDGLTNDCDEYPFAMTHEGSYSVKEGMTSKRSYAVRALCSLHNSNSGSALSLYLAEDHILEEDTYYTIINN